MSVVAANPQDISTTTNFDENSHTKHTFRRWFHGTAKDQGRSFKGMAKDSKWDDLSFTSNRSAGVTPPDLNLVPSLNQVDSPEINLMKDNLAAMDQLMEQPQISKRQRLKAHLRFSFEKFKAIGKSKMTSETRKRNSDDKTTDDKNSVTSALPEQEDVACYKYFKSNPQQLSLLFEETMKNKSVTSLEEVIAREKEQFTKFGPTGFQIGCKRAFNVYKGDEPSLLSSEGDISDSLSTSDAENGQEKELKGRSATGGCETGSFKRLHSSEKNEEYPSKRHCHESAVSPTSELEPNDRIQDNNEDMKSDDDSGSKEKLVVVNCPSSNENKSSTNEGYADSSSTDNESASECSVATSSSASSKIYSIPTGKEQRCHWTVSRLLGNLKDGTLTERKLDSLNKKGNVSRSLAYQKVDFFQKLPDGFFDNSSLLSDDDCSGKDQVDADSTIDKKIGQLTVRFNDKCSLFVYNAKRRPVTVCTEAKLSREPRPILKRKENVSELSESMRVKKCDSVRTETFLDYFNQYRKKKTQGRQRLSQSKNETVVQVLQQHTCPNC
ncbi:protein phosphatase regulator GIP1 KNAG_0J00950 [Huiozyma naganishii CBS 8797]|uniref:Uncharacterized protein n=1 Tax=Huiozyma naganishii (strain ATCC MYA-139 / BCRC 22969 / CBS 8797 / KCTC 17520 / NBRC 10181 / NCYC 3082 / Yp74L-3) TaxID=1071383 RepID=J7S2Q2_HUIN7|nr:hypothetical protein KNAG_0J00950 [Kazachstania naganishii CBS 8797]CCK72177.1 hypothetical protein KNAG_0J00950 [Kazachstania naganishii CBS 8797]